VVIGPFPEVSGGKINKESQRESTRFVSELQSGAPDRIIAFACIDPNLKHSIQNVEEAITKLRCRGIKLRSYGYPYEEKYFALYKKIEELQVPILFHSGICYGRPPVFKGSKVCHPIDFEVLVDFPRLKFALAYIGDPWIDECLSLFGKLYFMQKMGFTEGPRMYIDITPLPHLPELYYKEQLIKKP